MKILLSCTSILEGDMGRKRAGTGVTDDWERITVLVPAGYKTDRLDGICDHFGKYYSDLGKFAIEELWRRRNEPSSEIQQKFAQSGLVDVIPDFLKFDFSHIIK
jgi:hypothetical protein